MDEIFKFDHLYESYGVAFTVVLFIMLYKVVLTFESVDEILYDHLHKTSLAVLSQSATGLLCCILALWILTCLIVDKIPKCEHAILSSTFLWCCLFCCAG